MIKQSIFKQKRTISFLVLFFFLGLGIIKAQAWREITKTLPEPYLNSTMNYFGQPVAIDGDYAVVGAKGYLNEMGCAYVLYNNSGTWEIIAQLTASDGAADDYFGNSVSISGENIVIGAYGDDDNGSISGSAYVFTKPAGGWITATETAKLTASDGVENDYFGNSVSISGENIVVGASGDDDNGSNSGSAYVFIKPAGGWITATETAKLTASDGDGSDYFGKVSISGENIVVGAYGDDDNGSNSGSAYVFIKPAGDWITGTETAKLTASDGASYDYFAYSVSISGENIVIGAYYNGTKGSAYVFTKPAEGWITATETAKFTASDGEASDYFGISVSISGESIVIGATGDDNNGSSYVFTKPAEGWITNTETAKLTASDGTANDNFGGSVSISGENIIIGASGDDDNGTNSGSAYVFTEPVGGWLTNHETQKQSYLLPILSNNIDSYGKSVAIDGDYAVVGAPGYLGNMGCAYVLYNNSGTWETIAQLTASDGAADDNFGISVGISGENIVIGAYGDGDNGSISGSAYVFTKPAGGWITATETAKLTASDASAGDSFGNSVSISGENIVIGAYCDDDNGSISGSAYVFTKPLEGWITATETAKLTASDGAASDLFGVSVSISGENIVIGAYRDDDNGSSSGSAYVFTKPLEGWITATETAKLTASDGAASDLFGVSVSISGESIVIGATGDDNNGSSYVFTKPAEGWITGIETAKLTASDGASYDHFAYSVSISGENIVIGASDDDDDGSSSGSAYVFTKPAGGWITATETAKLTASDGAMNDFFGYSVSISGENIIVGAYLDDDNGSESGSAYIFSPIISTNTVIVYDNRSATLRGTVYSYGLSYNVSFEYGLSTTYGTTLALESPVATYNTEVSSEILDLIPNTTYHYRAVVENAGVKSYGLDKTFTTLQELTITGISANYKVYDGTIIANLTGTASLNGIIPGATDVILLEGVNTFSGKDVGTRSITTSFTISGADADKYVLLQPTGLTAEITAMVIAVVADANQTKVYGETDPVLTYRLSSSLISGDSFTGALLRAVGEDAGTYEITQGDLSAGSNYTIIFVGDEFVITKANPLITWANPDDIYSGTALSSAQLNATSNIDGTFEYTPALEVVLEIGENQELTVEFKPIDAINYNNVNATAYINVLQSTGVSDLLKVNVSVYPNPSNNYVFIKGIDNQSQKVIVQLIDASGVELKSIETENDYQMDISDCPEGIYFLRISNSIYTKTLRIVKIK